MSSSRRATAIGAASLLTVLLAMGLSACAKTSWVKAGADEARRDADLERCEAHARQETDDDFVSRMEETSRGVVSGTDALHSRDDLRRLDVYDRRTRITEACMRQLGYTAVETEQSVFGGEAEVQSDDL